MKAKTSRGDWVEKAASGWVHGCNSAKYSWLMPDSQYRWAVNCVARGGIPQTRPGYIKRLALPPGNLQGGILFRVTATASPLDQVVVFAVDGKVYYAPFVNDKIVAPRSWETQRIKSISFNPLAKKIFFCAATKSVKETANGLLAIVATYSVLMMQDGSTSAAYWDGTNAGHLNQSLPDQQTPTGTWMSWTGNRLWVDVKGTVVVGDIDDPLTFKERTAGTTGRGDFPMTGQITGFANTTSNNSQSNLIVFTEERSEMLQSSITNRDQWDTTPHFQSILFPNIGCSAGDSVTYHAGLIWWYTQGGMVNLDIASALYLTSVIKFKDIEMAQSTRNLSDDISGICGGSFEAYLMMSIPSGDALNAHTEVLDYAPASEIIDEQKPAWNGIWKGTRPIKWIIGKINGKNRCFHLSIDYQSTTTDGSFNSLWECFQDERDDVYTTTDVNNVVQTVKNRIYCSWETKSVGDGMDLKKLGVVEADLTEIGGTVDLQISYAGSRGGYIPILNKTIVATISNDDTSSDALNQIISKTDLKTQSRRVVCQEPPETPYLGPESDRTPNIDKYFSLYFQWCGRMGVEAFRMFMEPVPEKSTGSVEKNETGINVVTSDGQSFIL